jgi:peptide/nickel transport system substrate-binding protein
MQSNYWQKVLDQRISRRRALAATGATAAGAALLAACGGGGSDTRGDASGIVVQSTDTTAKANRNGTLKERGNGDPPTLDIFTANNPHNSMGPHVYSALVRTRPYPKGGDDETVGDLAETWERSADGLQLTLKLRANAKFHNKAPLNGRVFDAQDAIFSWERFATKGSSRSGVANSANPQAPVLSVTATDARTIVIKLKEPIVYAIGLFTSSSSGGIVMIPKETDTTYNIGTEMIGTGPFVLENYTPSVGVTFVRNEEYWDKDAALVARIEKPMVTEYSAAIAQLKAGNMYSFGSYAPLSRLVLEDVLPIKREEPRLLIYEADPASPAPASGTITNFGWLPAGKSPFMDERVRQAFSMAIDRDLYLDTFSNKAAFAAEGLPINSYWGSVLNSDPEDQDRLDPLGKDFGPNAKYYKFDLAEAKKLLAAAGYPNGFSTISHMVTGPQLATEKHATVIDGFWRDLGVESVVEPIDYAKDYIPNYRDGRGQFEGWAYKSSSGGPPSGGEAIGSLTTHYWAQSALYHGFEDQKVQDMIEAGRIEPDDQKRRNLVFELQRYLAGKMYVMHPPGATSNFLLAWPALANFNYWRGTRINERLWIDQTKPPFTSA